MHNVFIPIVFQVVYPIPSCIISVLRDNIIVITFSERVINFSENMIQFSGGTIANFIGNGTEFCVTVTTDNSMQIYVPSGVVMSVNNQPNTQSNRFIYNA